MKKYNVQYFFNGWKEEKVCDTKEGAVSLKNYLKEFYYPEVRIIIKGLVRSKQIC